MLTLRAVTINDALTLLQWKNDPLTRRNSIVTEEVILWTNHVSWLEQRLKSPGFYIIMDGEVMCGDLRFELGDEIEVSIRIAPEFRGKHLATQVLGLATSLAQLIYQKPLIAKIVDGNTASYTVFIKAGFIPVTHCGKYTVLKRG